MHPRGSSSRDDGSNQPSAAEIRSRHAEMYWALNDELLAASTSAHLARLVLSEGVLNRTSGLSHWYDFTLRDPAPHLRPSTQSWYGAWTTTPRTSASAGSRPSPARSSGRIEGIAPIRVIWAFLYGRASQDRDRPRSRAIPIDSTRAPWSPSGPSRASVGVPRGHPLRRDAPRRMRA